MSIRHLILLAVFLVAQGFFAASRSAFHRAIAAANEKLPDSDAIDPRRALLKWGSVRRTLRRFEDASKSLTRADLLAAVGVLSLVGLASYLVATWDQA